MEEPKKEIDTSNDQMIGVMGEYIVIMKPNNRMTKLEALRHAAWIVALADDGEFPDILNAIQNT